MVDIQSLSFYRKHIKSQRSLLRLFDLLYLTFRKEMFIASTIKFRITTNVRY